MSTSTSKLGLLKPDGNEFVNRTTQVNDNWNKLDAAVGFTLCTSLTRPGSPWNGQPIFETDTKLPYVWDGDSWELLDLAGSQLNHVVVRKSAPQVINIDTTTPITWDLEGLDIGGLHSGSDSTLNLGAGLWRISGCVAYTAVPTNVQTCRIGLYGNDNFYTGSLVYVIDTIRQEANDNVNFEFMLNLGGTTPVAIKQISTSYSTPVGTFNISSALSFFEAEKLA